MQKEYVAAILGGVATIVAAVLAALIGVWYGRRPEKENSKISTAPDALRRAHKYDVFVSSPLAGFASDAEIEAYHHAVVPLVEYLERDLGVAVFWAGRKIKKKADFDLPDFSARDDVEALKTSRCFLMLYPQRAVSSVLFEAGIALRTCLVSIYFVRKQEDLPFLMVNASQAFLNVRTYEAEIPENALQLIKRHGKRFFEVTEPTN
jgi:hypothetical protein